MIQLSGILWLMAVVFAVIGYGRGLTKELIALAGIIVRNSILLVDFVNQQLRDGVDLQHAVIAAASARAQPILLTGLAAMLGALFILDDPIFNGLALALIFGILVSTLLTLVVIPVLYYAALYKKFE